MGAVVTSINKASVAVKRRLHGGAYVPPPVQAARKGDANIVRELLESGADVNIRDNSGVMALIKAAQKAHVECVHTLIELGADVDIRDTLGGTALTVAVESDSLRNLILDTDTSILKCVQLLLKVDARINTGYQSKTLFIAPASDAEKHILHVPALLLAARERLEREQIKNVEYNPEREILLFTPESLKRRRREMALKRACRKRIRKHLLTLDPHRNLFLRVGQLPLPENLTSYFLHQVSLDREVWDCDSDWDFW